MSKNYSTTVSLNTNDSNRWQFVYASQAYGTFYGIYALFTTRELFNDDGSVDNTKVGVEEISLELINYKGPVDLSLIDFEVTPPAYNTEEPSNTTPMIIDVKIQANISNEVQTDANKPTNFVVNHDTRLEVNRVLLSINGLTKDELDAEDLRLSDDLANQNITKAQYDAAVTSLAFKGGVFDEEYFFRNGKLQPKLRRDGDFAYTTADVADAQLRHQVQAGSHLGYWCIGTRSKLLTQ